MYYVKVKHWSQEWLIAAEAYPGFCSMKRLEVFLLPLDGMLVHRRSLPRNFSGFPNNLPVPIYTPGWREALWKWSVLPKNTTQWPRPGLEPGPLAPESSAPTMRPPRLPHEMDYGARKILGTDGWKVWSLWKITFEIFRGKREWYRLEWSKRRIPINAAKKLSSSQWL